MLSPLVSRAHSQQRGAVGSSAPLWPVSPAPHFKLLSQSLEWILFCGLRGDWDRPGGQGEARVRPPASSVLASPAGSAELTGLQLWAADEEGEGRSLSGALAFRALTLPLVSVADQPPAS